MKLFQAPEIRALTFRWSIEKNVIKPNGETLTKTCPESQTVSLELPTFVNSKKKS